MIINLFKRFVKKMARIKIIDTAYFHKAQEISALKKIIKELNVDVIFDIGANAGRYAQMLRRDIGYKGPIISCEPIPNLASQLRFDASSDSLWFIEECVVSDSTGNLNFNLAVDRECSSLEIATNKYTTHCAEFVAVEKSIVVNSVTLDELLKKWSMKIDFQRPFVKLDTQGHDLRILLAAKNIQKIVGFQSELSVKRLYEDAPKFDVAINKYIELGFDISAFISNNGANFLDLVEFDCLMIRRDLI